MEQVIRTYGTYLLEAAVLLSVVSVLFWGITDGNGNKGALHIAGSRLTLGEPQEGTGEDFAVYAAESGGMRPLISYIGTEPLCTGKHALAEYIRAEDQNGTKLPFQILGIEVQGEEMLENYDRESTELDFLYPGIYTFRVLAVDESNRRSECFIRIPVNER